VRAERTYRPHVRLIDRDERTPFRAGHNHPAIHAAAQKQKVDRRQVKRQSPFSI
jgi:hypothetical protein